ncbi:hypothetical protein QCA50_004446 [Cerrena zonata]|uniref:Uncharacterized protein n=1 Tax=Cerrena zonata TaxID=2478898 RepID=A0AAW0GHH3_9APHY
MGANSELLTPRHDVNSQYDGSDTFSVTSSEDDHWGAQIGGYNENSAQYPPMPIGLQPHAFESAETVAAGDLEAMLEVGFDDRPSPTRNVMDSHRYQLSESRGNGYTPLTRAGSPVISPVTPDGMSSALQAKGHAKKRSGGRSGTREYGPLGPLDPGTKF